MRQRIKQFFSALTACIDDNDKTFVAHHLDALEQALFWGMSVPDQRHAINVAQTAQQLADGRTDVDGELLIKCCLLHDIGRRQGDVSTSDKVITVLAHRIVPGWAKCWGREGRGGKLQNLRHAFYVYFHHPARSAAWLRQLDADHAAAAIVERHHTPLGLADQSELVLLQAADQKN